VIIVHRRFVLIAVSVLAAMAAASAGPAVAHAAVVPVRAAQAIPSVSELYDGDACYPANGGSTFECVATGSYADQYGVHALGSVWDPGYPIWNGDYPQNATTKNLVTAPTAVSCTGFSTCLLVGEHFSNSHYPVQLVEGPTAQCSCYLGIINQKNPVGSTWSVLQDASCATGTFCMTVGKAGTTRRTSRGLVYISHATAYTWNGSKLTKLSVPAPAHSRGSELAGVACSSATSCLAVGNYTSATGKWRTYSAAWNTGTWTLTAALTIPGETFTTFQAVSCTGPSACMAVGDAYRPGSRPFAEIWNGSTWQNSAMPSELRAGLTGVSCPATNACVASGFHGNRSLIEAWNGTTWTVQKSPDTRAPFTGDNLLHVACVTTAECVAVGFRYNPTVRPSRRQLLTLAEYWNGASWQITKTYN
jgi:hypothetical protein